MPDLSDVLGDVYDGVYGGGSSAPEPEADTATDDHAQAVADAIAEAVSATLSEPEATLTTSHVAEAPDWADESRLDAAFATWRPGPDRNAPAAERKLFGDAALAPVTARSSEGDILIRPRPLDQDMAAALSEALAANPEMPVDETPFSAEPVLSFETDVPSAAAQLADLETLPAPEPEPELALVAATTAVTWHRGDDDLLPGRRARFSLRNR